MDGEENDKEDRDGFVYDPERDKYFCILPNHLAPPGYQYTQAWANRRKEEKQIRKMQAINQAKLLKETSQRSKILSSSTAAGIGLFRETGVGNYTARHRKVTTQAYATGFREAWKVDLTWHLGPLCYDSATGAVIAAMSLSSGDGWLSTLGPMTKNNIAPHRHRLTTTDQNHITSLSLSPSRVVMATSASGKRHPSIVISTLAEAGDAVLPDSDIEIAFKYLPGQGVWEDIWACSANPFLHGQTTFAAAMEARVELKSDVQGNWGEIGSLGIDSDPLALDWMTPSLVAIGLRNGAVQLWDTRAQGTAIRLQHPTRITGMHRVSSETLVVCGIPDALAMYDFRMPVVEKKSKQWDSVSKGKRTVTTRSSKAVVNYDFKSHSATGPGFAIDVTAGLVAAVDSRTGIELYSLHSGGKIKTLPLFKDKPVDDYCANLVKLHFCQGEEAVGGSASTTHGQGTLLATYGSELHAFQW